MKHYANTYFVKHRPRTNTSFNTPDI